MSNIKWQGLRAIYRVIEWKDGCVFKTKHIGYAYVTLDTTSNDNNIQYHSPSTAISLKLGIKTMRKVSADTPDYVEVDINSL